MTTLAAWEKLARFQPVTIRVMAEHADRLARSIGAQVLFSSRHYARAELRRVYGPPITGELAYAGRLHELGHLENTAAVRASAVTVRLGGAFIANTGSEMSAWKWAKRHALIWTPAMEAEKDLCLATYKPYARHGLADPIWRELARVDGRLALGHARHRLATVGRPSIEALRQRLDRVI